MRLTACLIIRDEERYLDACLSRISAVTDSIVVVDTGSTDKSREIALGHGAVVIDEPWQNNFSHARNVALDKAAGEWILYIDADELLHACVEDLHCLNDPDAVAATVDFRASRKLTTYREYRLFRNRTDIRFKGVIHETVMPDINTIVAHEKAHVIHAPICIEHLGYEGDMNCKHERNHGLLLQAVQDDPNRVYLWHALGECELGLGHIEDAENAWRQALAIVRAREALPADALIYADLISLHFSGFELEVGDVDELVNEAGSRYGSDPLVSWWRARHLISNGKISSARKLLLDLVQADAENTEISALAYDRRLFGAYSWALLGSCDMAEKAYSSAAVHLERALQDDPDNIEVRIKRDLARALA